ncbi:hypothetical protein MGN70_008387 [Eutypa lata]|nr:hypothetical protein MGN70_008387 [Eutypa lata]
MGLSYMMRLGGPKKRAKRHLSLIRISNKSQPAVLPYNTTTPALIQCYREKIVQSLVLAQFSRGGSFIVETLIHYLVVEQFLRRDSDPGIWLLLGNLVQIAMRMGYHREASHFRNISIYEGEMRRRVWMTIYQIDLNVSTQLGMPRIIKDSTTDTLEPRNLSDSDFDANSTVLPPSRSDTDPMPMLFLIAKARIVSAFSIVSDLVTNPRPYSYAQVLKIDTTLNGAHANLPEPCRRIYIQLLYHKAQIILHQRYLVPSRDQTQYAYSRKTAIEAALQILRYQHLVDEESKPGGRLESIKWSMSSLINHEFLLATSVLCFCAQHRRREIAEAGAEEIADLLGKTRAIWIRSASISKEASRASEALRTALRGLVVGSPETTEDRGGPTAAPTPSVSAEVNDYFSFGFQTPFSFFNPMLESNTSLMSMGIDGTDAFLETSPATTALGPKFT